MIHTTMMVALKLVNRANHIALIAQVFQHAFLAMVFRELDLHVRVLQDTLMITQMLIVGVYLTIYSLACLPKC